MRVNVFMVRRLVLAFCWELWARSGILRDMQVDGNLCGGVVHVTQGKPDDGGDEDEDTPDAAVRLGSWWVIGSPVTIDEYQLWKTFSEE